MVLRSCSQDTSIQHYLGLDPSSSEALTLKADEGFIESNEMHSINGYLYGNLHELTVRQGDHVRWYVASLGNEDGLHTLHWHGMSLVTEARSRVDTISLLPAESFVLDSVPDSPGSFMVHCHVQHHVHAGMIALFHVEGSDDWDHSSNTSFDPLFSGSSSGSTRPLLLTVLLLALFSFVLV